MTIFATADVIGVTTGRLLSDIGGIYKVVSFLIGRDAYTHEIVFYGDKAAAAILAARPDLPDKNDAKYVDSTNFQTYLARLEEKFGTEIELPDSLRDSLADDRNAVETATEMVGHEKVIVLKADEP